MSAGEEPEDDYEPVDHGDPNVPSITIKSSGKASSITLSVYDSARESETLI